MKRTPLYNFGKVVVTPIFKLLFRYRVNNKNNLPEQGGYILCCNHVSLKDPVFLALGQKRQIYYMAKEELFHNKFLSTLIRALGAFPVHRGSGDTKAINNAELLLEDGKVLGIFIEGTRSRTGELLRPKSGAAMMAFQTGKPVVPACISCKEGKLPKLFRKVTISYSNPMTPEELGLKEGTGTEFRNASRRIMDIISTMREKDIQETN